MGIEKITKIEELKTKKKCLILWDIQVSGGDTFIYNGIVIHNSYVEHGIKGGMQEVQGHYRKGNYVRSFTRYMPPRIGKFFIKTSVDESFSNFAEGFKSKLSQSGFKVVNK